MAAIGTLGPPPDGDDDGVVGVFDPQAARTAAKPRTQDMRLTRDLRIGDRPQVRGTHIPGRAEVALLP
jgi:hypothetical protein